MTRLDRPLGTAAPSRSPHHPTSHTGLVGGGSWPRVGEISLAHRGRFLDELPEFSTQTLKVLRQPLEDMLVTLTRASGTVAIPANVSLVAGSQGTPSRQALCGSRRRAHKRPPLGKA